MDDVTHTSIEVDADFDIESDERVRAVFFGLGADGTVGANKNSIKIIGEETDNDAQGYFVYDSKKSGAITISHLRFGPGPIRSSYLIRKAGFVACHQFGFLEKYDMLEYAVPGGTFLLNAPYGKDEVWKHLPRKVQEQIVDKKLKVYAIDAYDGRGEDRAWAAASTRSCRPASSRSPASCRARRRSPRSRRRSRRPTARRAPRSSSATSPRSTRPSRTSTRSRSARRRAT